MRPTSPFRRFPAARVVPLLLGISCGDATSVPPRDLSGHYEAVSWTVILFGDTTDALAVGGHYELTLRGDQSAHGIVVVPASPDFTFDIEGAWAVRRDTLFFGFDPELPLGGAIWLVQGDSLFGRGVSGYEVHHLYLARVGPPVP